MVAVLVAVGFDGWYTSNKKPPKIGIRPNFAECICLKSSLENTFRYLFCLAFEPWVPGMTVAAAPVESGQSVTMSVIVGYIVAEPHWSFLSRVRLFVQVACCTVNMIKA